MFTFLKDLIPIGIRVYEKRGVPPVRSRQVAGGRFQVAGRPKAEAGGGVAHFPFSNFHFPFSASSTTFNDRRNPMSQYASSEYCTFLYADGRRCRSLKMPTRNVCLYHWRHDGQFEEDDAAVAELAHRARSPASTAPSAASSASPPKAKSRTAERRCSPTSATWPSARCPARVARIRRRSPKPNCPPYRRRFATK